MQTSLHARLSDLGFSVNRYIKDMMRATINIATSDILIPHKDTPYPCRNILSFVIMSVSYFLTPLLVFLSSENVEVDKKSVYSDKSVCLRFNKGTFFVESENDNFNILPHKVEGIVKGLSDGAIRNLLRRNDVYFKLDRENQILNSNLRLRGGDPIKKLLIFLGLAAIAAATAGCIMMFGLHDTNITSVSLLVSGLGVLFMICCCFTGNRYRHRTEYVEIVQIQSI